MLIVTTEQIAGKKIIKVLGLVHGEGYFIEITKVVELMTTQAEEMGANAIVGVRLNSWTVLETTRHEAYGTAVVVE